MTAPDDDARRGGAALELNVDKTLVFLRLNRIACARIAEVLSRAAASSPHALKPGSEEAEDLTNYLNASLGASGVAFGEVALDDTLPDVQPRGRRQVAESLKAGGRILLVGIAVLALLRGLVALARDAWILLHGIR